MKFGLKVAIGLIGVSVLLISALSQVSNTTAQKILFALTLIVYGFSLLLIVRAIAIRYTDSYEKRFNDELERLEEENNQPQGNHNQE